MIDSYRQMIRNCRYDEGMELGRALTPKSRPLPGRRKEGAAFVTVTALRLKLLGRGRSGLSSGLIHAAAAPGTPAPGVGLGVGARVALAALVARDRGTRGSALARALALPAAPALTTLTTLALAALGQSRHRPEHYHRQGESYADCQPSMAFHLNPPLLGCSI